ncbi:hypothetical protein [Jiulongibacter sediminis]|uniref:hypothetical protein n=1 Tax=Jiulongibacter sediminis TaxID=1605367 RepID=UPI0026EDF665|nr:hypothetical protein [Jiulongibacter sediminis]
MKTTYWSFLILLNLSLACQTQRTVVVEPSSYDISDNLDLKAVGDLFGRSRDLREFERKLNDPENRISNLDLNGDGFVDYLRVMESTQGYTHVVTIQAAIGQDLFQDVATIDVDRDTNQRAYVQIIGHPYFYGPGYIIQPSYYYTPLFYNTFWSSGYMIWRSPYYYNYYPSYFSPWRPITINNYITHIHQYRDNRMNYIIAEQRRSSTASQLQNNIQRNDYASKNPQQSFTQRNQDVRNKAEMVERRDRTEQSDNIRRQTPSSRETSPGRTQRDTRTRTETPSSRDSGKEKQRQPSSTRTNDSDSRGSSSSDRSGGSSRGSSSSGGSSRGSGRN